MECTQTEKDRRCPHDVQDPRNVTVIVGLRLRVGSGLGLGFGFVHSSTLCGTCLTNDPIRGLNRAFFVHATDPFDDVTHDVMYRLTHALHILDLNKFRGEGESDATPTEAQTANRGETQDLTIRLTSRAQ